MYMLMFICYMVFGHVIIYIYIYIYICMCVCVFVCVCVCFDDCNSNYNYNRPKHFQCGKHIPFPLFTQFFRFSINPGLFTWKKIMYPTRG